MGAGTGAKRRTHFLGYSAEAKNTKGAPQGLKWFLFVAVCLVFCIDRGGSRGLEPREPLSKTGEGSVAGCAFANYFREFGLGFYIFLFPIFMVFSAHLGWNPSPY